jgi:hypothetical protein
MEGKVDPPDLPKDGETAESGAEDAPSSEHVFVSVKRATEEEKIAEMGAFGWTLVDRADLERTEMWNFGSTPDEGIRLHFLRDLHLPEPGEIRRLEEEYWSLSETSAGGSGALLVLAIVVIPLVLLAFLVQGNLFLILLFAWAIGVAWALIADRTLEEKERVVARKEELISKAKELLSQE